MDIESILEKTRSTLDPDLVYAPPHEHGGVTVIPASRVIGAGGVGGGQEDDGGGGGYAVRARPAGVVVVEPDGTVRWRVPFDLNRVILGGQAVGVAFFFFLWLTERSKARAAAKAQIAIAARRRTNASA